MPYKTLYRRRQNEAVYMDRQWYIDDARRLSWVEDIIIKVEPKLDKHKVRGFIVRDSIQESGGIPRCRYTIVLADRMAPEVERLVTIKELMHIYFGPTPDNEKYATDTAVALGNHFRQFFGASATMDDSLHVRAEKIALWMAIGVLCSESQRKHFISSVLESISKTDRNNKIAEIASILKAPLHTTKALLSHQFDDEIAHILK